MKQCRRPQKKKHRNGAMRPYIVCLLGPLLKRAVFDRQFSPHYDPRIEKKSRVHSRLLVQKFALVLSDHWFGKHEASPMVKCFDASLIGVENLEPIIAHRC